MKIFKIIFVSFPAVLHQIGFDKIIDIAIHNPATSDVW